MFSGFINFLFSIQTFNKIVSSFCDKKGKHSVVFFSVKCTNSNFKFHFVTVVHGLK